jgi:hypothetical protein
MGPIDLIRFEGDGNSVVLRITGTEPSASGSMLTGEFQVETPFVRGNLHAWVFPDELREWRDALDALDAGEDIAWRTRTRGASMLIERDQDVALVTIKDDEGAATAVTVTVPLSDPWFDDAYERLDRVWQTWPPAGD